MTVNYWALGGYLAVSVFLLVLLLTEGRAAQARLKRLSHGEVAAVGERCLDQPVLHAQVLKPVEELGVGHVNSQLLQRLGLAWVEEEAHLTQPLERLRVAHSVSNQPPRHRPLVYKLVDLNKTNSGTDLRNLLDRKGGSPW